MPKLKYDKNGTRRKFSGQVELRGEEPDTARGMGLPVRSTGTGAKAQHHVEVKDRKKAGQVAREIAGKRQAEKAPFRRRGRG